jgi:hypothetical protein
MATRRELRSVTVFERVQMGAVAGRIWAAADGEKIAMILFERVQMADRLEAQGASGPCPSRSFERVQMMAGFDAGVTQQRRMAMPPLK